MATATQKITLSSSRDIPFNKLVLSQSNVRRVKAGVSVEELAESIARRGLIQSLHVRPELDTAGKETGLFEVPAGGRRYRALELLVKQKRLNKTTPVPCIVSDAGGDILIDEVSLAENIERAPLHPLDQFRAFQTLREKGMSEEEIAAAFFVDAKVVKQRLRLVSVSPALLDVYAEDGMTLEQLMAFSVSEDHARQEQVWEAIKDGWQKEPYTIRRLLTETTVRASDKRALFVGIDAYEAAGGYVLRDLFQQDDGGWLQDPVLLDRLVGEKLKAEAETIAEEGWKWLEIAADFPYGHTSGLRRLAGTTIDLTDEERAEREKLRDEFDALEAEYAQADEFPDEVDARLAEIEEVLDALESRPMRYDADQMARAGVFVSIRHDGQLAVERGYVRPEDEVVEGQEGGDADGASVEGSADGSVQRAVITVGGAAPKTEEDEEVETIRSLSFATNDERTAKRVSDALGTATELKAMKNYAGHRLSPWLGHLMVSRSETARQLLTPGEIMQLPPEEEIVMVAGIPPIRATKARYYEDTRFKERILSPPELKWPKKTRLDDWTTLPVPVRPKSGNNDDSHFGEDEDPTGSEHRLQPELRRVKPVEKKKPIENEFEFDLSDDVDEEAAQNRRMIRQVQGVARQVAMDPNDGMEL